ncbi:hypothetical protein JCM11641_003524 [Rhodosporidiobolus odoratus]
MSEKPLHPSKEQVARADDVLPFKQPSYLKVVGAVIYVVILAVALWFGGFSYDEGKENFWVFVPLIGLVLPLCLLSVWLQIKGRKPTQIMTAKPKKSKKFKG